MIKKKKPITKTLVREGKIVSSKARINALKKKIADNKKLVSESKTETIVNKLKAKKKSKNKIITKRDKKVITESKLAEIREIKAKKKAKKSKSKVLNSAKVKSLVSEAVMRKLSKAIGKKRSVNKDLIKEEDDDFDELLGSEEDGEDALEVSAELDIDTDEPIELVISPDDMQDLVTTAVEELKTDEDFINTIVNTITGDEEPIDAINDELDTDVDMDLVDDLEGFDDEGDILDNMLEEEGLLAPKKKMVKESKLDVSLDRLVLEGYEKDDSFGRTKKDKKEINIHKYKIAMKHKIADTERIIGSLYTESTLSEVKKVDDEMGVFDVTVDDDNETIEISSSSMIKNPKELVQRKTGLDVKGVKKSVSKEKIDIDDEITDDFDIDIEELSKYMTH